MSTTGNRKSVDELEEALVRLDERLGELGVQDPLEIRAIGGYALMKHRIRPEDRAFTVDIDTVTRDYQKAVLQAIQDVALERGLDSDWLNNYNVTDDDPRNVTDIIGDEWEHQPAEHLSRINVAIASVPMLTRSKIIAATDAEVSGRTQDRPDLIALVEHQGITTLKEYDRLYPDEYGEHAEVRAFIGRHIGEPIALPGEGRPEGRFADADIDDLDIDALLAEGAAEAAAEQERLGAGRGQGRDTGRDAGASRLASEARISERMRRFPELRAVVLEPYSFSSTTGDDSFDDLSDLDDWEPGQ